MPDDDTVAPAPEPRRRARESRLDPRAIAHDTGAGRRTQSFTTTAFVMGAIIAIGAALEAAMATNAEGLALDSATLRTIVEVTVIGTVLVAAGACAANTYGGQRIATLRSTAALAAGATLGAGAGTAMIIASRTAGIPTEAIVGAGFAALTLAASVYVASAYLGRRIAPMANTSGLAAGAALGAGAQGAAIMVGEMASFPSDVTTGASFAVVTLAAWACVAKAYLRHHIDVVKSTAVLAAGAALGASAQTTFITATHMADIANPVVAAASFNAVMLTIIVLALRTNRRRMP